MQDALPLSFPAILRNAGLTERFSHLQTKQPTLVPLSVKRLKREYNEGKRWVRRSDNGPFYATGHSTHPHDF